jgi:hypothetical protein
LSSIHWPNLFHALRSKQPVGTPVGGLSAFSVSGTIASTSASLYSVSSFRIAIAPASSLRTCSVPLTTAATKRLTASAYSLSDWSRFLFATMSSSS